jgi:hypothetical protein
VSANIPHIIRAGAAHSNRAGIVILLNIYFVKCTVAVVFDPEDYTCHQLIMFNQLNESLGMDLFSTAYHFIGAVIVNIFDKVR